MKNVMLKKVLKNINVINHIFKLC